MPSDELETSLVRSIARIRLGWTVGGLATAALERRHYDRPGLAAAGATISIVDAAWAVSRSDRRNDVAGAAVGVAVSTGALVAMSAAAGSSDQFGGLVDWAFHATLLTAGLTAFRIQRLELGAAITAIPVIAYVATVSTRSEHGAGLRPLANGVQFGVMFGTAAMLSRTLRRSGHAILAAQRAALVEASRTASERARTDAVAELHSGARSALLRTRDLLAHDRPAARRVAAAEAARLRNVVVARDRADEGLIAVLAPLVEQAALSGGRVDFVPDLDAEPSPAVSDALAAAVAIAFDWLVGTEEGVRCVLRVTGGDPVVELTIRQRRLATPTSIDRLVSALAEALLDVDGSVEVSAPAPTGIRIVMRAP